MSKNGLVARKITGSDGIARTYWVKPEDGEDRNSASKTLSAKSIKSESRSQEIQLSSDEINDVLDNMDEEQRNSADADAYRSALTAHKLKEKPAFSRDTSNPDVTAQIAKAIQEGGGTIRADGAVPNAGFCYSPYPERSRAIPVEEIKPSDMVKYMKDNGDMLKKKGNCIGIWHNQDDGKVYFDISCVTEDASDARQQCKEHDQIAFFDMNRFEEVTVDKNATSGGAA